MKYFLLIASLLILPFTLFASQYDLSKSKGTTQNVIPQLVSLILESNATSLNLGEKALLSVTGTYEDNSTKELTSNIEWSMTPEGSVEMNGTTLTVLKDVDTTVQAKVANIFSNTLNFELYWEVNGHRLPPEPDPTVNNSTLLGIDMNDNGVRDDVERWIYETYKDKHPIHIDIAMQVGRASKKILEIPLNDIVQAKVVHKLEVAAVACEAYYKVYAKYFNEPLLVTEEISVGYFEKLYFNTTERNEVYTEYAEMLSGDTYPTPKIGEGKNLCDFNTVKYEE